MFSTVASYYGFICMNISFNRVFRFTTVVYSDASWVDFFCSDLLVATTFSDIVISTLFHDLQILEGEYDYFKKVMAIKQSKLPPSPFQKKKTKTPSAAVFVLL